MHRFKPSPAGFYYCIPLLVFYGSKGTLAALLFQEGFPDILANFDLKRITSYRENIPQPQKINSDKYKWETHWKPKLNLHIRYQPEAGWQNSLGTQSNITRLQEITDGANVKEHEHVIRNTPEIFIRGEQQTHLEKWCLLREIVAFFSSQIVVLQWKHMSFGVVGSH